MKIEIGVCRVECKIRREAKFRLKRVVPIRCHVKLGINSKNTEEGLQVQICFCHLRNRPRACVSALNELLL